MIVTETQLDKLRLLIKDVASARRYGHILGVERMAARLASIYCPEKEGMLRAAALLHDVTKEKSFEEQLAIFEKYRVNATEEQLSVPPTIHAVTAPLIIPDEYPEYSDAELLNAIRYHSTGRENMTLSEKIIFLSDYIEDTRTFEDCIALREEFFSAFPEKMSEKERINHLNRVLLHSMELTIEELRDSGKIIESATLHARDSLRRELAED
jgi:predicted HD superfamily hydrolase involved in NAD metabolism